MAAYTWQEFTTHTVEYLVPSGSTWAEFAKALQAAGNAYRKRHRLEPDAQLRDDAIRVEARDDQLVIAFTVEQTVERP